MVRTSFVSLIVLLLAGCGAAPKPGPDVELCEHLKDGPSKAVTATAASTGAPDVSSEHTRYDVLFVDVTGGKGGSVSFASAKEADHAIALSAAVPVKVADSTGAAVAIEQSATSSRDCGEIKGRQLVPLKVGTYTLTFGPTTASSVQMVIEAMEHAH